MFHVVVTTLFDSFSGYTRCLDYNEPMTSEGSNRTAHAEPRLTPRDVTTKRSMTPEERKRQKDARSANYYKLMEKYGPKRRFLIEKENNLLHGEHSVEPVGFVVKFRLSHAYKALEKQEIEAGIPDIKPVKKRKRAKFLLPGDGVSRDHVTGESTKDPDQETSVPNGSMSKRVQIRARLKAKSDKGSLWKRLTAQKASEVAQKKEKEQKKDKQKENVEKKNNNPRGKKAVSSDLQNADKRSQSKKVIEASLVKLKDDVRALSNKKSQHLLTSHFQGRSLGLPSSHGDCEYQSSDTESVFRMFSDSAPSSSITMEALTISGSRPSSTSKRHIDPSSRPSSARQKSSHKPRTSTPAHSNAPSKTRDYTSQRSRPTSGKHGAATDAAHRGRSRSMHSGVAQNEESGGDSDAKVLAPRKICKYLYHMCNCQQVARKNTLSKLLQKKKVRY